MKARISCSIALFLLLLAAPFFAYAQTATYMVPMRDSVKLATDVHHLPFGKWPTILIRTPYNKSSKDFP
jgi:predicted acyl esterase